MGQTIPDGKHKKSGAHTDLEREGGEEAHCGEKIASQAGGGGGMSSRGTKGLRKRNLRCKWWGGAKKGSRGEISNMPEGEALEGAVYSWVHGRGTLAGKVPRSKCHKGLREGLSKRKGANKPGTRGGMGLNKENGKKNRVGGSWGYTGKRSVVGGESGREKTSLKGSQWRR